MSELTRDFNVKQVEVTADKIPDDIKVLVVIHPKGGFRQHAVSARSICPARRQADRLCRSALRAGPPADSAGTNAAH